MPFHPAVARVTIRHNRNTFPEHFSGALFRSNKDTKNPAEFGVAACRTRKSGTLQT